MEGGTLIEAAGAATDKWGLGDLLNTLDPRCLVQLSIQGPWSLPAAALSAVGRLTGLTHLKIDSAELPGDALLAAVGQLAALRAFELNTDEAPQGMPHALARLSRLEQLHLEPTCFGSWKTWCGGQPDTPHQPPHCAARQAGQHPACPRTEACHATIQPDHRRLVCGGCDSWSRQLVLRCCGHAQSCTAPHSCLPGMGSPLPRHRCMLAWLPASLQGPGASLYKEAWYSADHQALGLSTDGPAGPFALEAVTAALLPSGAPLHSVCLAGCLFRPEDVGSWSCREALTDLEFGSCILEPGTLAELLRQLPRLAALFLHYGTFNPLTAGDLARLSADASALRVLSLGDNELRELPDAIDLTGGQAAGACVGHPRVHAAGVIQTRLLRQAHWRRRRLPCWSHACRLPAPRLRRPATHLPSQQQPADATAARAGLRHGTDQPPAGRQPKPADSQS